MPPDNYRRNHLIIDLQQLKANLRLLRQHAPQQKIMAVLKANAYGLGLEKISEALVEENIDAFGVAELSEALQLSQLKKDVYILGDILKEEIPQIVQHDIIAPISTWEKAQALNEEALRQNKKIKIQFLIDTGMGRLGTPLSQARELILKCRNLSQLNFHGIYSHFPHAYGDQEFSIQQIDSFKFLLAQLDKDQVQFPEIHIANSDGIQNIQEAINSPFTMIRSGINLYGCFDLEGQRILPLKEIIKLESRLIALRQLPKGSDIGYGRSHTLEKDSLVGTVCIGYADGLPIALSDKGHLLIHGQACPIIGRVSMDYCTVLVPKDLSAQVGDTVTCLGGSISVSDWAREKQSITYEIICSLSQRVQRIYS